MKSVLFISKSILSYHLVRAIVPLIPKKVFITCLETLREIGNFSKRQKDFQLIIVDWNTIADKKDRNNLSFIIDSPQLKKAKAVLIHSRNVDIPKEELKKYGFKTFYGKPFLTDEVAKIISSGFKK